MFPFSSALSLHHLHSLSPFHFSSALFLLQLTCPSSSLSSFSVPFSLALSIFPSSSRVWVALAQGASGWHGCPWSGPRLGSSFVGHCVLSGRVDGWWALTSVWLNFNHSTWGRLQRFWLIGWADISMAFRLKHLRALSALISFSFSAALSFWFNTYYMQVNDEHKCF